MVTIDKTRSLIQKKKTLKKLGKIEDYLFRQNLIAQASANRIEVNRRLRREYNDLIGQTIIYGYTKKNYQRIREIIRLLRDEDFDPGVLLKSSRMTELKSAMRDYKIFQETK